MIRPWQSGRTQTFVYVFEIISYCNKARFEIIVYYHNTNLERTNERRSSFIQLWCPLCTSTAYLIDYLSTSKVVKGKMQGKGQLELDNSRNTTCWDLFCISINLIGKHSRPITCTRSLSYFILFLCQKLWKVMWKLTETPTKICKLKCKVILLQEIP
jgi:hypothetical protein